MDPEIVRQMEEAQQLQHLKKLEEPSENPDRGKAEHKFGCHYKCTGFCICGGVDVSNES